MAPDPHAALSVPGFELVRELGRGAMGVVYLATDRALKRSVAIKFVDPAVSTEAERLRFAREARLFGKLSHPNLVRVYDADPLAAVPYLVMELIEGRDLGRALLTSAAPDAVELGRALASALAYIHAQGILHRDLKPANVLLAGSRPLLTDFGLAREQSADTTAITLAGAVLGTPAYMAPEVVRGEPHSPASDVYSLALIVHEIAAAGSASRAPGDLAGRLQRRLSGQIPTLASMGVEVAEGLDPLLASALALEPAKRPDAEQLQRALEGLGAPAPKRRSGELRKAGSGARVSSRTGSAPRPFWLRRGVRQALGAAAVVLLVAAALVVRSRGGAPGVAAGPGSVGTAAPEPGTAGLDMALVAAFAARSRETAERIRADERAREPVVYRTRSEAVFEPGAGVSAELAALARAEHQALRTLEQLDAEWDRLVPGAAVLPLEVLAARAHTRSQRYLIWTSVERVEHVLRMAKGKVTADAMPIPGVGDGIEQLRKMSYPPAGAGLLDRYFTDAREVIDRLARANEPDPELLVLVDDLFRVCQTFRAVWDNPSWTGPYCLAYSRMRAGVARIRGTMRLPLERVLEDFWSIAWTGCGARKPPTLKSLEEDLGVLARASPQRAELERLATRIVARLGEKER